jgi:hypothetical protein
MCGPSSQAKNLNNMVQNFTKQVTAEAGTVFTDAQSVFNNIVNSVQSIINGGPSQAGFSQNEVNAKTAAAVQAGGTMARNLRGATAAAAGAIGGGNTVAPSGSVQSAINEANIAAAEQTANAKNQIVQENFATGRENFWNAEKMEESAPSVMSTADSYNKTAGNQLTEAQKSQQAIDTANNWWKTDLMNIGMSAAKTFTNPTSLASGFGNMSSDSSFGENVGNFFEGLGNKG